MPDDDDSRREERERVATYRECLRRIVGVSALGTHTEDVAEIVEWLMDEVEQLRREVAKLRGDKETLSA